MLNHGNYAKVDETNKNLMSIRTRKTLKALFSFVGCYYLRNLTQRGPFIFFVFYELCVVVIESQKFHITVLDTVSEKEVPVAHSSFMNITINNGKVNPVCYRMVL